jgi:Transposase DDE domain
MSLLELFCDVDDYCQAMVQKYSDQLPAKNTPQVRQPGLRASEIITILVHFHQSHYRNFKMYYIHQVRGQLRAEFPNAVSYERFIQLMERVVVLLWGYAWSRRGECTGISFIDSTSLDVCDNHRISRHRVFKDIAERGHTSMGYFYGFKLHLVVNEYGELLAFTLTPGNVDDREPVPTLTTDLFGKLFGDKGYLSQALFKELYDQGVQLITGIRSNMKNKLMPLTDKLLLRKRFIIETINDQLKNVSQIEHSRHRKPLHFLMNVLAGLIAYSWQDAKPAINWSPAQEKALAIVR